MMIYGCPFLMFVLLLLSDWHIALSCGVGWRWVLVGVVGLDIRVLLVAWFVPNF